MILERKNIRKTDRIFGLKRYYFRSETPNFVLPVAGENSVCVCGRK